MDLKETEKMEFINSILNENFTEIKQSLEFMDDINFKSELFGPYYNEYKGFDYGESYCVSAYKFQGQIYQVCKPHYGDSLKWVLFISKPRQHCKML